MGLLTLFGNFSNTFSTNKIPLMQYRFLFPITMAAASLSFQCKAQDCAVSTASLAGRYEGDCKNGKADGNGKATGEDSYEGSFRSGVPDGKGKYTWKNGDYYDGEWFKGVKSGAGIMRYKLTGKDSIVTGFWKKDKYIGLYEKPYMVYKNTIHVTEITCKKVNNSLNQVELFLNSETGGIATSFSEQTAKPELTDIQVITGNYVKKEVNDTYPKKIGYLFQEVTFPFRVVYTIDNGKDMFELEISEAGKWNVQVRTAY
jgi:hypothetical protein